jgi:hypothetical protein
METTPAAIDELIQSVGPLAEVPEVQLLIELVRKQQQQIEQLKDELSKLKHRSSHNSSVPPSQDLLKKPSRKEARKPGKKRGPKYDHPGSTRNGFGQANQIVRLSLETCPVCGRGVTVVEQAPVKVQQVADLVEKPVEIWEYQRPKYHCDECGWSGYGPLPWGVKEGFSYGARLSSVIGWLGYGGNLTWHKQIFVMESIFKVPMSQGSLAKMHQWFQASLEPSYQQWLKWVQEPGVRCVDETTYLIDGIKHWLWVATSDQVCVLLLAPTRSAAELKQLLGENFEGILISDCFSAYNPQPATAKQKCLTHLERDLRALETSRFAGNRDFSSKVSDILKLARQAHRDYHSGQWSLEQLHACRRQFESQLQAVLDTPPPTGWPADAQRLRQRLHQYWSDWFTFLSHPEVKPDNNDAERALRPVVVHRKVSGTARSDWGAKLVAKMFSFLETMRLQGVNAVEALFEKLSLASRSPPKLKST